MEVASRYADIDREISFGVIHTDGRKERKTIQPISEAATSWYRSLGRGSAEDPGIILNMAFNHCPDFFNRVVAYRLVRSQEAMVMEKAIGTHFGSVEFYEWRT
jgi:hypothetical protein